MIPVLKLVVNVPDTALPILLKIMWLRVPPEKLSEPTITRQIAAVWVSEKLTGADFDVDKTDEYAIVRSFMSAFPFCSVGISLVPKVAVAG